MNDLYIKKYQYEKLIRVLINNYNLIQSCLTELNKCKNKLNNTLKIDDNYFNNNDLQSIINKLEDNKNIIINNILPQARYQYNNIIYKISMDNK